MGDAILKQAGLGYTIKLAGSLEASPVKQRPWLLLQLWPPGPRLGFPQGCTGIQKPNKPLPPASWFWSVFIMATEQQNRGDKGV